jgi:hypothetical protein
VESNIRAPSDNRLLADSVRVLVRTVVRARELLRENVQEPFEDFTQAAKQVARQIGETLRKRTDAAKEIGRQQYEKLLEMTEKTMESARCIQKQLSQQQEPKARQFQQPGKCQSHIRCGGAIRCQLLRYSYRSEFSRFQGDDHRYNRRVHCRC